MTTYALDRLASIFERFSLRAHPAVLYEAGNPPAGFLIERRQSTLISRRISIFTTSFS